MTPLKTSVLMAGERVEIDQRLLGNQRVFCDLCWSLIKMFSLPTVFHHLYIDLDSKLFMSLDLKINGVEAVSIRSILRLKSFNTRSTSVNTFKSGVVSINFCQFNFENSPEFLQVLYPSSGIE